MWQKFLDGAEPILVASKNPNKCRELQSVADAYGVQLLSVQNVQAERQLEDPPEVEESGDDYRANALLKAKAYSSWSGLAAIGDDSGLEVDILAGRPGLRSARYLGEEATYEERMVSLLAEVRTAEEKSGESNRRARFFCSLAFVDCSGGVLFSDGELAGQVLDEMRGDGGFGYDPLILIDEFGKTLAEVDFSLTCTQGFRARAAQALFEKMREAS